MLLPLSALAEETNGTISFFGITITQSSSPAEKHFQQGFAYYTGDGTEQDSGKAFESFKQAALLGHAQAQFNLGACYVSGIGVAPNEKEAASWFEKAAMQGIKEAVHPLGICLYNLEQYTEAYAWALLAEAQGDIRLKEMLDPMYTEEEIAGGKARFEELKRSIPPQKE